MFDAARRLFGPRRAPARGRRRSPPPPAVEQLEARDVPAKVGVTPVASVLIGAGPNAGMQEEVFALDAGHKLFAQVETLNANGQFVSNPGGWQLIRTGVKSVAAVEGVMGTVEVFAVDTSGKLNEQIAAPNAFTTAGWTQIGAGVKFVTAALNPAAVNGAGRVDVFAIDTAGNLFEQQAAPGALANGNWTRIATGARSVVASFNVAAGKLDIFEIDTSGNLFEQQEGTAPAGTTFTQIGGGVKQVAAAFNPATNQEAIFAVDSGGNLFLQQEGATPATAAWARPATGIKSAFAETDPATGKVDVFAIDTKGNLFEQQLGTVAGTLTQIGAGVTFVNVPSVPPLAAGNGFLFLPVFVNGQLAGFNAQGKAVAPLPAPAVFSLDAAGGLFQQTPVVSAGNASYFASWTQVGTGIAQPGKGT